MKRALLVINHVYLSFGTTIYAGVLWALHFFWYPSWQTVTVDVVHNQFVLPTSAATHFFWHVVPLMFLANVVLIISERKDKRFFVIGLVCLALQSVAQYVGQGLIIPINKQIADGVSGQPELTTLLERWMTYNDIRWVLMSAVWLLVMTYFVWKGRLLERVGVPRGLGELAESGATA